MSAEARERRLADFLDAIDYRPSDRDLIDRSLRHRSAPGRSYERLEFLGDAVLDTVVSQVLFERFPDATEGVLSRLRAAIVRDASLAEVAAGLKLGNLVQLGQGELKSGGARRDSILADALEAVFGAVFVDGGYHEAERVILRVLDSRLATLELDAARKDAKTELQERLQRDGLALPVYALTDESGPPHRRRFRASCRVEAIDSETEGRGLEPAACGAACGRGHARTGAGRGRRTWLKTYWKAFAAATTTAAASSPSSGDRTSASRR